MKLKDNKGVTGIDVAIATLILIAFVSLITGLFYNLTSTSKRIERKSTATSLAIEVIEALKVTSFSNLVSTEERQMTIEELNTFSNKTITIPNGYSIKILVENYKEENIVKIITVEVSYLEGKNTESIKLETLVKNIQQ